MPAAAQEAASIGWEILILTLVHREDLHQWTTVPVELTNPLSILMKLRSFKPTHICMVGALAISDKQREGLQGFLRSKSHRQKTTGDTGMSRLIGALEFATGAKVIGVHEILPGLIAPSGIIAGPEISSSVLEDCDFTFGIAKEIGKLDIGQAAVCAGHRVIGVEDIAGTDALMARVKEFVKLGITGNGRDPLILAKTKKPGQPTSTDLPAIGPDTITMANQAGISVICVEAEHSLLIQKSAIIQKALEFNISVIGIKDNG